MPNTYFPKTVIALILLLTLFGYPNQAFAQNEQPKSWTQAFSDLFRGLNLPFFKETQIIELEKTSFKAEEQITVSIKKKGTIISNIEIKNTSGKKVPVKVEGLNTENIQELKINPPEYLIPGKYTLNIQDTTGQTITQDFSWGVLAINTNKSVYKPNETAKFSIAVLDENGKMACDAKVKLIITPPKTLGLFGKETELSTENNQIRVNDECHIKDITENPDFETSFQLSSEGDYHLKLIADTKNGSFTLEDNFQVKNQVDFEIERLSATRIFPPKIYPVTLKIKANKDFTGFISENVPSSFKIFPSSDSDKTFLVTESPSQEKTLKQISWQVDIKAGETIALNYSYKAPEISPEFYNLGPLKLIDNQSSEIIFKETRVWQIAADATNKFLAFWDGGSPPIGWVCVSCQVGDPFYQTFPRGAASAGGTGGATTHTHTATEGSQTQSADTVQTQSGQSNLADSAHTHPVSGTTVGTATNLPVYQNLKIIRYDTVGDPPNIPNGAIVMFDAAPNPSTGWTRYSAQDGDFLRGENDATSTGGSSTHTHSVTANLDAVSAGDQTGRTGTADAGSSAAHTHILSSTTASSDHTPSRVEVLLYKNTSGSAKSFAGSEILMSDGALDAGWSSLSGSGGDFENRFLQGASSYNVPTANDSHTPANLDIVSAASASTVATNTQATATVAAPSHTHTQTFSFNSANNLPPYMDVIIAKKDIPLPTKVVFTNSQRTLTAGACNGDADVLTIQLQDDSNSPTNPTGSTVVRVTSNSSNYTIYSDNTCNTQVTNGDFTFTTSENTKNFYIKDFVASSPTWTLTATKQSGPETIAPGNQSITINPDSLDNFEVTISTPQTAGVCFTGTNTIKARDQYNNYITSDTSLVNMTSSGTGVTFYTDSSCTAGNETSQYTLSSGTSNVYLKTNKKQSLTVTATKNASSINGVSSSVTVNAGTVTRLVVTMPGQTFTDGVGNSNSATNRTAGASFNITSISATDNFFNVNTGYSGSKTLVYSGASNAPDSTSPSFTTSVNFSSGQSTTTLATTLYKAETTTFTVTEGGNYGFASSSFTINPGEISADSNDSTVSGPAIVGPNANASITITLKDTWRNPKPSISAANIQLESSGGTITQPSTATDSNGQTTGQIKWASTGSKTVSVAISNDNLVQNDGSTADADSYLDDTHSINVAQTSTKQIKGNTIIRGHVQVGQ